MNRRELLKITALGTTGLILTGCFGRIDSPTSTPSPRATDTPTPTRTPEPTSTPEYLSANKPEILAGYETADQSKGKVLDTPEYGKRVTYTSRSFIFPEIAYNEPLTDKQLKKVEQLWQRVQVRVPQGSTARVFAGGYRQEDIYQNDSVLLTLEPGVYDFEMRNGEVAIRPDSEKSYADKDKDRIMLEIRKGNRDIPHPLVLARVTADLMSSIPQDILAANGTEIMPAPEKTRK